MIVVIHLSMKMGKNLAGDSLWYTDFNFLQGIQNDIQ